MRSKVAKTKKCLDRLLKGFFVVKEPIVANVRACLVGAAHPNEVAP